MSSLLLQRTLFCCVGAVFYIGLSPLWGSDTRLPNGAEFKSWEQPLKFTKTYYVDNKAPSGDDQGPGNSERPFRTINHAAKVLQAGERVVIREGVYRECIQPERGGSGPDAMISYEAEPGAKVIVKGSVVLSKGWEPSNGWGFRQTGSRAGESEPKVWQIRLGASEFGDYNPFAIVNIIQDRFWLDYKVINMVSLLRRRGLVFVDGKPLEQVDLYRELAQKDGRYWVEHNGQTLHVRLTGDAEPSRHLIEAAVKEQVFAPAKRQLGYIRVKGITFQHASNGFPVPQRGLVSTNRGHHWIIEGNTIEWANAVGLDVGRESWEAAGQEVSGFHIIRGNTIRQCGICALAGVGPLENMLIEDNLVEHTGWHDIERMYENGGIKFHNARNLLIRRNIIRHVRAGSGLWLDVGNTNCRITGNVIADVVTLAGGIQIEGTHEQNQIDNNIIWDVRRNEPGERGAWGIFADGTDKLIIAHNLIGRCENSGFHAKAVEKRINSGRGGTARANKIYNNIFYSGGPAAIEFANQYNEADGNLYAGMPGGFLRILFPEPQQWLDLEASREFHGWEKTGQTGRIRITFDPDTLALSIEGKSDFGLVKPIGEILEDFFGKPVSGERIPGPFSALMEKITADPRTGK